MKKLFTFFSLALLSGVFLMAQTSGGPDLYGYTWTNSNDPTSPPAYNWFDITTIGTPVTGLGDDNFVGPYNIPGGFDFYWYKVNKFWIGSNGYISFQPGNVSSAFPAGMGLSTGVNDWIGVMTSDLNFATSPGQATNPGECYYYASGDTVCVSWVNVPFWISSATDPNAFTGSNTFQVILNKANKSITINYQSTNRGLGTGTIDDLVGIENNSGNIGLSALIDVLPPALHTIRFTYPPVVTYVANDAGIDWNGNPGNGGIFASRYHTYDLVTNVRNFGNTNLGSFNVNNTVTNPVAAIVTSGSVNIPSLARDSDTIVTFTNKFTPVATGIHIYNTLTNLGGDVGPTNNTVDQKVVVVDTNAIMALDYSDGTSSGSVSWTGGNGGCAIYIEPPVYPVRVISSRYFITANTGAVGYSAIIYDDDGPNGGPGTVLDSVGVAAFSVTTGNYNTVPVSNTNLLINDGGVYLYWQMGGANINLGTDNTPPASHRSYEVLIGSWAPYRSNDNTDFMMGLNVVFPITKANFSINKLLEPEIQFTDLSSNSPHAWEWDFGDGSPIDINQNPTHVYTTIDTFNVCLKVTNFAGSDSICKPVIITKVPPIADFNINSSNAPTIAFADNSSNNPITWHWDFGDGDTANTTNAVHTYSENGIYSVCLTVSNTAGADTICKDVEIGGIGIEEAGLRNNLSVYPNPVSGEAFIQLDQSRRFGQLRFKCFDLNGKQIAVDYTVVEGGIKLETTGMNSGSYIFEVYDAQAKVGSGRFVVK